MIGLAVLLVLAVLHAAILRMLAWPLEAASSFTSADYYCLHGEELGADGFEPFAAAAEWHGKSAGGKILLLLPRTSRIVEIGAVRSFEQMCRIQLGKRGVPPADIWPIRAEARDVWDEAHAMNDWLKAHPGSTVSIACSPFASGRLRHVFNRVGGSVAVERVRLAILPDPDFHEDCWWRSRAGVKAFMFGWLGLFYAWANEDEARSAPAGAAAFQQEIRTRIGEAPP